MNREELIERVTALLGECRTACLATSDSRGSPHACNVQFAFDRDLQLYFISSPQSEHAQYIARSGDIAAAIYAHDDVDPTRLRGVQLRGNCATVERDDADCWPHAWGVYAGRFEFVNRAPYREAAESQQMYRFGPKWLRLIDNREGFGFKRELNL